MSIKIFSKKIVACSAALLIVLAGCQKTSVNPAFERNIPGAYTFQKVKLFQNFSLGGKDQTDDYKNITIEFKSDHSLAWTDASTGQTQSGSWVLERVVNSSSDVNNCSFLIDINVNNAKYITGTSLGVTNNKIRFSESKAEGTYNYVLARK
jgi:hypothetical protein